MIFELGVDVVGVALQQAVPLRTVLVPGTQRRGESECECECVSVSVCVSV
jgi:hypothetical protein